MIQKILIGLMSVLLLVVSPKLFVFVCVGLTPSIVCSIVDVKPGRNTFQTVLFFNLSGVCIKFMDFLNNPALLRSFADALNPTNILMIYLFAALGYFVVWLVPKIVVIMADYKSERRALVIKEKITEMIEEWGPEVKK
jgi:hypothetical protein